jgi:uncharacterized protein YxjI
MKLCIKQRVFSWGDTYDVYDEWGNVRYYVEAEIFAIGHQIHVYEKQTGREVGSIHQHFFAFTPGFDIVMDGQRVGVIKKRFTLFSQTYDVDFRGWTCEGDVFKWDYQVMQGSMQVMSISKEWFTWGDTYVMEISNPAHELPGLLLVLAIDAANCDND